MFASGALNIRFFVNMWVLLLFETLIKCRMVINVRTSTNQSDNLSKNYFHQFLPELWPEITFIFKFFYLSWLFRLCISSLLYKVRNEPAISCCCFYFFSASARPEVYFYVAFR